MGTSLESSRPIMAPSLTSTRASPASHSNNRLSTRYSTYSAAPSLTPTTLTSDSAQQEIKDIEANLEKLENKKLEQQRFVLGQQKSEDLSKLALGAKLERALGRRMDKQDAVMRERKVSPSGSAGGLEEKSEKVAVS